MVALVATECCAKEQVREHGASLRMKLQRHETIEQARHNAENLKLKLPLS